jgi:hypothetical protein
VVEAGLLPCTYFKAEKFYVKAVCLGKQSQRMLVTHASESVPAFIEEEQQAAVNLGAVVVTFFFFQQPIS